MQRTHSVNYCLRHSRPAFLWQNQNQALKRVLFTLPQRTQNSKHWVSCIRGQLRLDFSAGRDQWELEVHFSELAISLGESRFLQCIIGTQGGDRMCTVRPSNDTAESWLRHLLFTLPGRRWFWSPHFSLWQSSAAHETHSLLLAIAPKTHVKFQSSLLWIARVPSCTKVDEESFP